MSRKYLFQKTSLKGLYTLVCLCLSIFVDRFFADREQDRCFGTETKVLCALTDIELKGSFTLTGLMCPQAKQTVFQPLARQFWGKRRLRHQDGFQPTVGSVFTGVDETWTI